jgi:AraC-like DNA-binding protein
MSGAHTGLVYQEREGVRVAISDDHVGSSFELPYARMVRVLEALIERPVSRRIEFEPFFDTRADAGGQLSRVAKFIGSELSAPRGTALESWDRTLEDLLIRSLLLLQPHSYSASLAGPIRGAAPYNVKRAEAFMQAHASEALTVERIAEASGCGIRSLQSAFRAFTGCSPMERLRIIRLEEAHLDLMGRTAVSTVRALAAKYQFSHPGRFTDQDRKMFGHPPRVR